MEERVLKENSIFKYNGLFYRVERFNDAEKYIYAYNLVLKTILKIGYSEVIELLKK